MRVCFGFNIVFQTDFLFNSDLFPGVYEAIEGSPQLPQPLLRLNALLHPRTTTSHHTSHFTRHTSHITRHTSHAGSAQACSLLRRWEASQAAASISTLKHTVRCACWLAGLTIWLRAACAKKKRRKLLQLIVWMQAPARTSTTSCDASNSNAYTHPQPHYAPDCRSAPTSWEWTPTPPPSSSLVHSTGSCSCPHVQFKTIDCHHARVSRSCNCCTLVVVRVTHGQRLASQENSFRALRDLRD